MLHFAPKAELGAVPTGEEPHTPPPPVRAIPSAHPTLLSPRATTLPTASPSASPSTSKRARSATDGDEGGIDWKTFLAPPPPRTLVTSLATLDTSTALGNLFGMPYPVDELLLLLQVARSLCPEDPLKGAFPGWRLVGPLEVLAGVLLSFTSDAARWRYARFRYDPPEVQTIAVSTNTTSKYTHICLHRDDPKELPSMVVGGRRGKPSPAGGQVEDPTFDVLGSTVGGAMLRLLTDATGAHSPPSLALSSAFSTPKLKGKDAAETFKQRKKTSVATTVHHLGVVVPYDHKTELGYRPMMMTLSAFQSLIQTWNEKGANIPTKQLDTIAEQFQWADIANDECDFGLNLEIGLNLFSLVKMPNEVLFHTWRVLEIVYALLSRDLFRHILKCHLPVLAGVMDVQWAA